VGTGLLNPTRQAMIAVIGLGNPRTRYTGTRHNIGQTVVADLTEQWGFLVETLAGATIARGYLGDRDIILGWLDSYMNVSGGQVKRLMETLHLSPSDFIIIYDDMHLPLGTIRIRRNGTAGGHNGMRSVIDSLGTEDIPRLRIGINSPHSAVDSIGHVLGKFNSEELEVLKQVHERINGAIRLAVSHGIDQAMNKFNSSLGSANN